MHVHLRVPVWPSVKQPFGGENDSLIQMSPNVLSHRHFHPLVLCLPYIMAYTWTEVSDITNICWLTLPSPLVGTSKVAQRAKEGNPDHLIPRKRASLQGMQPHTAMLPSQSLSIRAPHSPCHLHLHPLTPRSSHHEGMQLPQRKRRNKNSCNDHRRRNSFLLPSDPIFIPVIYLES